MRNVEIKIFCNAQTRVNYDQVQKWLEYIGCTPQFIEDISGDDSITDPALLIALAAKRCYMSFEPGLNPNITKVRKEWADYLENILKQGHGSVLEHSCFTFAIEGVSRVFTGEMNRHRAGVGISEGSMRFIRYTDIPYWLPDSITLKREEGETLGRAANDPFFNEDREVKLQRLTLAKKKLKSQELFRKSFQQDEENYKELQEIWKEELAPESKFASKKHITSMMRRIIPMGVASGGVWTMNVRAARHIIAMRASEQAEEEILHVFSLIAKYMVEQEPMLFGDFTQTPEGFWAPKYKKV